MNLLGNILERGVVDVIVKSHLEKSLTEKKKLRVKFGIDPTAPSLHLGHAVLLRKLRQLQELGHKPILIIGDFTALIGDPSGRDKTRPLLTEGQIKENMNSYLAQAGKILDIKKCEIYHNSEWYKKASAGLFCDLASRVTIQQLLEREDFQKRIKSGLDVTLLEIIYPLLQGYDSVKVKADLEIGGQDQKFNLLMGRRIQRSFNLPEQDIMTLKLLVGLDGEKKMSKSYGNIIGLQDEPNDMFGKVMAVPDSALKEYYELTSDLDFDENKPALKLKEELAFEIVKIYHGQEKAKKASENWEAVFRKGEIPEVVEEIKVKNGESLKQLVYESGLAASLSESQRLIEQGAVSLDGKVLKDWKKKISLKKPVVLKIGKHRFVKLNPLL